MNTEFIPQDLYDNIIDLMPIICVDGIIQTENGILLLLRDNEPEKNKWWFPGGRLLKGEKLEEGIVRKVKEETGLTCEVIEIMRNSYLAKVKISPMQGSCDKSSLARVLSLTKIVTGF